MSIYHKLIAAVMAAIGGTAAMPSLALEYPAKAVKIVVPYPPGGGADDVARLIAQKLGVRFKQAVVVENRSGATGMIGTAAVARAEPDGYTIALTHADTMTINPLVYKNISYNPERDFVPVAMEGVRPFVLAISADVPAKSLAEFLRLCRENPGKYTFSSPGIGSSAQIAMEMLKQSAGIDMQHVPYQGAGPAVTAVVAGQISAMMGSLTTMLPQHKAGKVRILGVTLDRRLPVVPEIPTLVEQGVQVTAVDWYGFAVPAKTPPEIVAFLNKEFNEVFKDPEVRSHLVSRVGMQLTTDMSPADIRSYMGKASEEWGQAIAKAHIQAD